LINAYKSAAIAAICNANIVEIDIEKKFSLVCEYESLQYVMNIIKDFSLKVLLHKNELNCEFTISCKQSNYDIVIEKIKQNHTIKLKI
jgi:putative IMPACT (imprinted ancient) family translation regulator